ncbi:MAG: alpha/beta hydrolase [Deltaproteobacteria bacterium]|nr:alpha/beta hydrolase [Deltaproteobacteria bacterium]
MRRSNCIYRTPEGREVWQSLYRRCLEAIPVTTESVEVDTRLGHTHVLSCGPTDAPPLVMLHGISAFAPDVLIAHHDLADCFRIHAVDVVGQPGRSAEACPKKTDSSYADWLVDVLDGLGIERAAFLGNSYGAFICMRMMAYAPERIERAVLTVPVCIARFHYRRMLRRLILPSFAYRGHQSSRLLDRASRALFAPGESPDPRVREMIGAIFVHLHQDPIPPPLIRRSDLARYHAPTLILGAEHDLYCSPSELVSRSCQVFPNLSAVTVVAGSGHTYLNGASGEVFRRRTREFLAEGS